MHNEVVTRERALIEAIALRRLVSAVYNGATMLLAPHLLYKRHDATFVAALNTARTWRSDEVPRLGQFKVDGLSDLALADSFFEPLPGYAGETARDGDEPIFSVAA